MSGVVSVFRVKFPGLLRRKLDDLRYRYWERFQNGNKTLQAMASDLAILEDELATALACIRDCDLDAAGQLVKSALDTVRDHQSTIRERL